MHELGISTKSRSSSGVSRRDLLLTTAISLIFSTTSASALDVKGSLPWSANAGTPPTPVRQDLGCISPQRKAQPSKRSSTG